MKLRFNKKKHLYTLDGVIIPGYSEIAKTMGIVNYKNTPGYLLEPAQKFGSAGHFATRLWDEKRLDEKTLSIPLIPCLEAYKSFIKYHDVKILTKYIERPICSYKYRYGITPDRICLIKGELSILEFKFVEVMSPGTAIQLAAQKLAANEYYGIKIIRRYALQLKLNGGFNIEIYKDNSNENTFLCFLGGYNWLKKNKQI